MRGLSRRPNRAAASVSESLEELRKMLPGEQNCRKEKKLLPNVHAYAIICFVEVITNSI